jgi:hypothetical protein
MPSTRFPDSLPVVPAALLISLLLSFLLTASNSQLNDDAFSYLRAAEIFQAKGLSSVLQDYGWYGYSVLVALADGVLPGSLASTAQVLNALCYLLLTYSFIALQREFGAGARQLWLAAAVILLFPLLNEMRHFIIRDVACWALVLLALLQLLRYAREPGLGRAVVWCACMLLAALFRLEVLLTAVLAPLALLWTSPACGRRKSLQALLQIQAVLLTTAVLILLLAWAGGVALPELMLFAWRYYLPELLNFATVLGNDVRALNATLFTVDNFPGSDNFAVGLLILAFASLSSVLLNLAGALGLPFTLLLLLAWKQQGCALPAGSRALWYGHVATTLLALLVFQFIMHFQTHRYATLLALLLLSLLPGCLEQWWQQAEQEGWTKRFQILLGVLCCYLALDSLVSFGYSKQHMNQAEHWLLHELPANATVASNSSQLAWRSGRIPDYDKITRELDATVLENPQAEYLVLEVKRYESAARLRLDAAADLRLLIRFSNERGDEVRIYQRQP